jgi:hypothetical protein
MSARQVDVAEFVARLSAQDRHDVEQALTAGMGVARYGGMNFSYGRKGAVIETKFPPAMYGSSELGDFVSPPPTPASMRSPLLDAVGGPPQIGRPRVSPSHTEYPDVQFETRTSSHPRGNSEYISPVRLVPGREPPQPEAQVPLSEEQAWLARRLGQR